MNQKERFQRLLAENNISQTDLLRKIILEVNPDDVNNLDKYSANFSRMISGERSFNQSYIVAIEEVLDTTINYLVTGRKRYVDAGIKQTAFIDKESGYNKLKEYDHEHYVLTAFDEFGYTLFDYILQFKSVNGLKFMIKNNIIKIIYNGNISYSSMQPSDSKVIDLYKFVYELDDLEIYNRLFNSDYNDITFYQHRNKVLDSDELLEGLLNTNNIFNSLLKSNIVDFNNINTSSIAGQLSVSTYKPILRNLFEYIMLNQTDKGEKFEKLLDFIVQHNSQLLDELKTIGGKFHITDDGFIHSGACIFGNIFIFDFDKFRNIEIDEEHRLTINALEQQINNFKKYK